MTAQTISIDDRTLMLLEGNLRRIFAMKITRSTYRELQNVVLSCANHNKELANYLFEILLTGQVKVKPKNEKHQELLEDMIKHFTIPARLSKEVHDRGEFINIITSDMATQERECALLNRIRRVDGEEFFFLSDPQNTVHVLQHFAGRLAEFDNHSYGHEELQKFKKELAQVVEKLKKFT